VWPRLVKRGAGRVARDALFLRHAHPVIQGIMRMYLGDYK
jgi:hypothetical protein